MTGEVCAALAKAALLAEVSTTPKPGLVDMANSGSHKDMDYQTFVRSAETLEPYFAAFYRLAREQEYTGILSALRPLGIEAETAMYRATGQVNTHKGALFSLGLLCAAWGGLYRLGENLSPVNLCRWAAGAASGVTGELPLVDTNGGRAYASLGVSGVRGEVEQGYPTVLELSLPCYEQCLSDGLSPNDSAVYTLIKLMLHVDDTNLLARGGEKGAAWAKEQAAALLEDFSIERVAALDKEFIRRNLSPGGCADLLALTIFLHSVSTIQKI